MSDPFLRVAVGASSRLMRKVRGRQYRGSSAVSLHSESSVDDLALCVFLCCYAVECCVILFKDVLASRPQFMYFNSAGSIIVLKNLN